MINLSKKDRAAKLEKRIQEIRKFRPDILSTIMFGAKTLSEHSITFKEWQQSTSDTIKLVFGEHSRYVDNFNDIKYSDFLANVSGDKEEKKQAFLNGLDKAENLLRSMIKEINVRSNKVSQTAIIISEGESTAIGQIMPRSCIFIGHGRNPLWAHLKLFLENDLKLKTVDYESESRVGESIVHILEKMLEQATFALLVLTAEDETSSGSKRARQNVIHEAGLFQGKLGFKKAILLKQEGTEDFSNLAGLQYISFTGDDLEQTFWKLREVLKREGQLS